MLEMVHVVNGITTMAFNCPSDGNVTIDFSVHNEKIVSARFSKSSDMVLGGQQVSQEKVHAIKPEFADRIINDIQNLRIKFGTIKVSVDIAHGEVKNYSLIPEYSLNANLLKAEMKSHANRQLDKLAKTA